MTLTVPRAPLSPGRAAQPQFETPGASAEIERFGQRMLDIGTAIQRDRLSRTAERLSVDLQNDMNALRLEAEAIGDPDALDQHWKERSTDLRKRYFEADAQTGQPRVPRELADRFGIQFDDLAGRHAYALGARSLELRNSQREANWLSYRHTALTQTAGLDPDTQQATVAQADAIIAEQVQTGVISPEEGERRRLTFREDLDQARVIVDMERDPAATRAALDAGQYPGLDAGTQARVRVQLMRAEEQQTAAAATARNTELSELTKVLETGLPAANAAILDDPAYQDLPNFAEAIATRELVAQRGAIRQMTVPQLRAALAEEEQIPITRQWQAERVQVMQQALTSAIQGWGSDPIAYAAEVGFRVPEFVEFDPANPQPFAAFLSARGVTARALVDQGFARDVRLFTDAERVQIRAAAGFDQDPQARAVLSDLLTQAGAASVVDDPVFRHVGGLAREGVPLTLRAEILRGQQVIEMGNIVMPPIRERTGGTFAMVGEIFAEIAGGEQAQARTVAAADALYAARVRRTDPTGTFDEGAYLQALHEVMGGTGQVTARSGSEVGRRNSAGGVQLWNEALVPFPRGVSEQDFDDALTILDRIANPGEARVRDNSARTEAVDPDPQRANAILAASSTTGLPPAINGQTVAPADLAGLQLRAFADDRYVFVRQTASGPQIIADTAGNPYIFSMLRLLRGLDR